jgi:hypothetical protein
MSSFPWFLVAVLALAVVVLGLALARAQSRGSRASTGRNIRAREGERAAQALLEEQGYEILGEQVAGRWSVLVDDEEVAFGVRADLLVARDGDVFIAEVKTGTLAPDPTFGPTRRQLLEYQLAFQVDGVLLVDADNGTIAHIAFAVTRGLVRDRAPPEMTG